MAKENLIQYSISSSVGFEDSLSPEIMTTYVLEIGQSWAATIQLSEYPELKNFDWMLISSLIVDTDKRRKRFGTRLMKKAMDDATAQGKGAYLMVYMNNEPALSLYQKLGFRIIRDYYYKDNPNGLYVMVYGDGDTDQLMHINFS